MARDEKRQGRAHRRARQSEGKPADRPEKGAGRKGEDRGGHPRYGGRDVQSDERHGGPGASRPFKGLQSPGNESDAFAGQEGPCAQDRHDDAGFPDSILQWPDPSVSDAE